MCSVLTAPHAGNPNQEVAHTCDKICTGHSLTAKQSIPDTIDCTKRTAGAAPCSAINNKPAAGCMLGS